MLRCTILLGDNNVTQYIPEIVPKSPNTASLGIYGQIPVGYYTGTPEISISIYNLKLDGREFPINLSYHASGIKVAQEASWVGLGWSLLAGGCITHDIKGLDDFSKGQGTGYYTNDEYIPYKKENNDRYFFYDPLKSNDLYYKYSNLLHQNTFDSEPDIYYFNFCNFSGSMSFKRRIDGESKVYLEPIVRSPKEYLNIKYYLIDDKWVITDNQGFSFYFGSKEIVHPYNMAVTQCKSYKDEDMLDLLSTHGKDYVSAWYLDSIVSPKRSKIIFKYAKDKIYTVTQQSDIACITPLKYYYMSPTGMAFFYYESRYIKTGEDRHHLYTTLNMSQIEQIRLSEIIAPDCSINFSTNMRKDLRKYSNVLVSEDKRKMDPVNGRLDAIGIQAYGRNIKNINFSYSYYGDTLDYKKCRLMLDSIYEGEAAAPINKYKFQYNRNIVLPAKNSNSIDYWGYYNGKNSNVGCWEGGNYSSSVLPSVSVGNDLGQGEKEYQFKGADRHADPNCMKAGILTSIQYPTGGKTYFEYEPHIFPYSHTGDTIGGGLRIKKIYNLTNNKMQNIKTYKYEKGTLMENPFDYYSLTRIPMNSQVLAPGYVIDPTSEETNLEACYAYLDIGCPVQNPTGILQMSSSAIPLSTNSAGAVVGYSQVEERWGDGILYKGKYIYKFHSKENQFSENPDIEYYENYFIPGFPSVPDLQNGLPKATEVYDTGNNLKQQILYNYEKDPAVCDTIEGFQTYCPPVCEKCVYVRYYHLCSEWWKLSSKTVNNYSNGSIQTCKENYTYDSKYRLNRSVTKTYCSHIYKTNYTYPFDYNSDVYKNMASKNMLAYPIEQTEYNNDKLYHSVLKTFKEENGLYLPYCIYSSTSGSGLSSYKNYNGTSWDSHYKMPEIEFSKYDEKGNILEYKIKGEMPVSIIWSYQKLLPVAQVDNMSYDELNSKIGINYLEDFSNQSAPNIDELYNKISRSALGVVSSFNVFEYLPSVGVTKTTNQRGVATYYNYDQFGRLINVKDNQKYLEKAIKYHTYEDK